ncbi:lytic transglycosylase [Mesorhizobium hawassense]|uniref:Lytic transglycosylase n=1 Tax=Mesorhizobium hawassense TaxID=1209954 RepID=A0A330H0S0_9HYPH|nr:type IV secretion system lytic transglycosylase VirB1 [Mesorhizobium hawassense]RAZ82156.1 lytic transglycosylase [Mesorhizobium hawassense]
MFIAAWPLALVLLASTSVPGEPAPLSPREFNHLSRGCAPWVAISTLAAIAKVESGFDPLVAYDNTTNETLRWDDHLQAARNLKVRLEADHSVDVGLMQINSNNFSKLKLTPETAFQPCTSLSAAAHLLESRYVGGATAAAEQMALRRAISAYNTGNFKRGFANGYVRKVEAAAKVVPGLLGLKPEAASREIRKRETSARKNLPPLLEPSLRADEMTPPEEAWDVWGSYRQNRSRAASSALPSQTSKDREPANANQLVFD